MTDLRKEFWRKCQFLLLMIFAANPIPLLAYVAVAPALLPFFWVIPVVCFMLMVGAFWIPGKFRMVYGVAGCVVMVMVGAAFLLAVPSKLAVITLAVPALYAVVLMMSLPVAGWAIEKELPPVWYWTGLGIHVGTFVFKFFVKTNLGISWDSIDPLLLVSFFGMAVLVLLSMTRINLNNSANGRQKPSAFMWQKNIGLTVGFFVLALLISMVPAVYQVLDSFFDWIGQIIADMINNIKIDDFHPDDGPGGQTPPADQGEQGPVISDNILTLILNLLFILMGGSISLFLLIWLIPRVFNSVRKLFEKFFSRVSGYVNSASEDYEDEVTDLRDTVVRQKRVRLTASEERSLPPEQRIRYRYRRLLSKHPNWTGDSTARENLSGKAAAYYEKARYSTHPITEEDAAAFTANTKRV